MHEGLDGDGAKGRGAGTDSVAEGGGAAGLNEAVVAFVQPLADGLTDNWSQVEGI